MSSISRRITILAFAALAFGGCGGGDPYQGMEPTEIFGLARQKYAEGDYDKAIKAFDRFLLSYSSPELSPIARLLLAHSYYANRDYLTAESEYQRFLDRFPGHNDAASAALGVCRSLTALSPVPQRDQTYTREAVQKCGRVAGDYPATPQADEATAAAERMRMKLAEKDYLNADFYLRRNLYDSAIKYFEFVIETYPGTEWAPKALLGLRAANLAIGYDDLAQEAEQKLLDEYPDSPAAAQVRADGATGN